MSSADTQDSILGYLHAAKCPSAMSLFLILLRVASLYSLCQISSYVSQISIGRRCSLLRIQVMHFYADKGVLGANLAFIHEVNSRSHKSQKIEHISPVPYYHWKSSGTPGMWAQC